jgi:hypothetical protein
MEHDPKIILRNPERLAYLHSVQPIHFPKYKDVCDPIGQFVQATLKRRPELLVIQRGLRDASPFRRAKRLIPILINEFVRQRKELRLQTEPDDAVEVFQGQPGFRSPYRGTQSLY